MKDVDEGEGRYGYTEAMRDLKEISELADRVGDFADELGEDVFRKSTNDLMYATAVCMSMCTVVSKGRRQAPPVPKELVNALYGLVRDMEKAMDGRKKEGDE